MNESYNLCKNLYKTEDGKPIELTEGQQQIFECILKKQYPRVHCLTYSQYGKSLTIGLGVLTAISTFPEKWAIVAPSNKKAQIIMGYIIDHIFDNEYTASKFEIGKGETRERIRRERRKDKINFKHSDGSLGEVFIISTEGRRTKDVLDALMGFGAAQIIIDESSLIEDAQYFGILRMLGGTKENFLCEIGNAMRRNHFYRTSRDEHYHRIKIDWKQGVKEGRITQQFIDEMKRTMRPDIFKILYDCEFPDASAIDDTGYSFLITENDLDKAYADEIQLVGERKLCVDVAAGGDNYSTIILKAQNGAEIIYRENNPDTMSLVGIVIRIAETHKVSSIFVDCVGVGKGVFDRLRELEFWGEKTTGINNGERPENEEDFINRRAQSYWRLGEAIKSGFKLKRHQSWEELLVIKWKIQSDRKIKIKSKEEMQKDGIISPDVADALALGFATNKLFNEEGLKVFTPDYEDY